MGDLSAWRRYRSLTDSAPMQAFSITLTVGVVLLFAGFVVSTVPSPPRKR